jgi:hypothetical protein
MAAGFGVAASVFHYRLLDHVDAKLSIQEHTEID